MVWISHSIDNRRIEDAIQMTPYDIGFNAGLDASISEVRRYADGEICPICGSDDVYEFRCSGCNFNWGV